MSSFHTRRNFLLAGMSLVGTIACQHMNESQTIEEVTSLVYGTFT